MSTSTKMSNGAPEPTMDEWVAEIRARVHNPRSDGIEVRPSIFGKWRCWDDFGASFIPETDKWQIYECMTQWYGLEVQSYLEYLQEKEAVAWSYYRGVDKQFCVENKKKRFIEHLMFNSCFLVFMMVFYSEENRNVILAHMDDSSTDRDIINLRLCVYNNTIRTVCYMFTMNYQIPWFCLEAVYTRFSTLSRDCGAPFYKIARLSMEDMHPRRHPSKVDGGTVPQGGFKHLLHFFHWSRQPDQRFLMHSRSDNKWIGNFNIPSATELQLSLTVLKKHASDSIDLSYCDRRLSGEMQLTPWYLMQYSTKLYESLLRFEQGYHGVGGAHFSAYFACMACLIKTEADVKVLRANGVIPCTSSIVDQDVLRGVQELKTLIHDNLLMPDELISLEEQVMTHHKKCVCRVFAEFNKRCCSSLWITLSVFAGICLFVLTFLQTLFSILSYKKQ